MTIISKKFAGWVLCSTAAVFGYLALIATPVYQSTASIMVANPAKETGGMSAFLSGGTGDNMAGAYLTKEFTGSWGEFRNLFSKIDLRSIWSKADPITAYFKFTSSGQVMFRYYKSMITTDIDKASGIITLNTRAMNPGEAKTLGEQVIYDVEQRINEINERKDADMLQAAEEQLADAKAAVAADNRAIALFRKKTGYYKPELDYAATVDAKNKILTDMAQAKADFKSLDSVMPNNPAVTGIQDKINSFKRDALHLDSNRNRINSVAKQFDALSAKRDLDIATLEKASALVQETMVHSARDHYYLNVISEPSDSNTADFPRIWFDTLIAFVVLSVLYKFLIA